MKELKIKMTDDSVHTIQGDVQKITVKGLGIDKSWTLKTVDTEGVTLVTPLIGGRPNDRK